MRSGDSSRELAGKSRAPLQTAPKGVVWRARSNRMVAWRGAESNCRHRDFQSRALPTELPRPMRQDSNGANRNASPPPLAARLPHSAELVCLLVFATHGPSGAVRSAHLPVKEKAAGSNPVWGARGLVSLTVSLPRNHHSTRWAQDDGPGATAVPRPPGACGARLRAA
jgi:hypothetical protein